MNNNKPSNFIIITIIISVLLGGIAGSITGYIVSNAYSLNKEIFNWFGLDTPTDNTLAVEDTVKKVSNDDTNDDFDKISVEDIVSQSSPAVVSIVISKEVSKYYNTTGPIFPFDQFFQFGWPFGFDMPDLNNNQQQPDEPQTEKQRVGAGTGFLISSDGLILTNKHVVDDLEAEYTVVLSDGTTYDATVLGRDTLNDLAVVKIDGHDLPTLDLGDSDNIRIGETVVAIGYALGEYSNTVTTGIVSGLGRDVVAGDGRSSEKLEGVIQTDTAINPGNSGGPLINLYGKVIGINTAINREGQLIGFSIPINTAKKVVDSVKKYGKIVRPFLGVRYVMLNEAIAKQNNLDIIYGALILRGDNQTDLAVMPGSPADRAGLVENDIILEINGVKLEGETNLAKEIAKYQPGDEIDLKIYHKGDEKNITITLTQSDN